MLTRINLVLLYIFVLITNKSLANELDSNLDLKDRSLIDYLKTRYYNSLHKRSDDLVTDDENENSNDFDNGRNNNNPYSHDVGSGIFMKIGGTNVNLCEAKYIGLAAATHPRIGDLLIAACSGHSGGSWLINKFFKSNKQN